MPESYNELIEELLTGTIASVVRLYLNVGHMPEHAIYQTMLRLQSASILACSEAGIDMETFGEYARFSPISPS